MRRTEVDAAIVTSVIKYKTVNTRQVIRFIGCIFFSFTLDTLRNLQESTELKQVQFEPYGIYFIFFFNSKTVISKMNVMNESECFDKIFLIETYLSLIMM